MRWNKGKPSHVQARGRDGERERGEGGKSKMGRDRVMDL